MLLLLPDLLLPRLIELCPLFPFETWKATIFKHDDDDEVMLNVLRCGLTY